MSTVERQSCLASDERANSGRQKACDVVKPSSRDQVHRATIDGGLKDPADAFCLDTRANRSRKSPYRKDDGDGCFEVRAEERRDENTLMRSRLEKQPVERLWLKLHFEDQ